MTLTPVQKAEIDRSAQKLTIAMIERKIASNATTPLTKTSAETQIENAQRAKEILMEIHLRIAHQGPADMDPHELEFVNLSERLDTAIENLKEIINKLPSTTPVVQVTPAAPPHHHIKLPDIHLPSFDGKFEDWPSFEDLFKATVDKNKSLSGAQKLQYLKSYVAGEASNLIKSFTVTDPNYIEAWNLLSSRYNNRREIIYSLVKKILYQQHLKNETVAALQSLLNSTLEAVRSLKVLGRPTDTWDDLLVVSVIEKFDPDTKSEWAKSLSGTDPPKFIDITAFLERHIRSLIAKRGITSKNTSAPADKSQQNGRQQARSYHISSSSGSLSTTPSCLLCRGNHHLFQCKKLLEMQPSARMTAVRKTPACLNCLREGHKGWDCSSKHSCKHCSQRHHSLLHVNSSETRGSSSQQSGDQESTTQQQTARINMTTTSYPALATAVLLKTAIVQVTDSQGIKRPCRIMLDDCSEASLDRSSFVKAMGLIKNPTDVMVEGVGEVESMHSKWSVSVRLESCHNSSYVDIEALVVNKVSGIIPKVGVNKEKWDHLHGIQLADPLYHQPGDIDILIGADEVISCFRPGMRRGPKFSPAAYNTIFGWVLTGRVSISVQTQAIIKSHHVSCNLRLENLISKFWRIEEIPNRKPMSKEEKECENIFKMTTTRNPDGRYVVRLPLRTNEDSTFQINGIGHTRSLAERRLLSLERRFARNPQYHQSYIEFMREYIALGHMEVAPPNPDAIFIPHHYVIKEDSSTTKLRVVFDASMPSTNGISLNQTLLVGPTVQDDLFTLLTRFRFHVIALKGDLAKMYRQFEVHSEHRDNQRILWREDSSQPILEMRLKTVTYGMGCASYLATRCLDQLAEDEKANFPIASKMVRTSMYIDDLLGGKSTEEEATAAVRELVQLFKSAGIQIRKWCSNSPVVMNGIPEVFRETGNNLTFDEDSAIKTLGVSWQPTGDYFTFFTRANPTAGTKRQLLSEIAKTFDPLGLISPFTINLKILFQNLWETQVDWDDAIDSQYQERWTAYQEQLQLLSQLQIPRCVVSAEMTNFQLIGFSDASERALASSVYFRCNLSDGSVKVNLVASKTRVAPVKQVSIPRLELCAALLLVETIEPILNAIKLPCTISCYTDSMVVLKWWASPSRRWKMFVASRVATIQEVVPGDQWHHVRTHENPADLPSRGITAEDLLSSSLWWHGPEWLSSRSFPISSDPVEMEKVLEEERSKVVLSHATIITTPFIVKWSNHFSSLRRLVSATAVLLKFICYLRRKSSFPVVVSVKDRETARITIMRLVQQHHFYEEGAVLRKGGEIKVNSKLKTLSPFLDSFGIIRVGGRLHNANVATDIKHPIVLPKHSHVTRLIIEDTHYRHLHSGLSLTHAAIRQRYWILGGKDLIRLQLRKCVSCQ